MNGRFARFSVLCAAGAAIAALPGCSHEHHHDYDEQAQPAGYHYEPDYHGPYPYYGPEYYRRGENEKHEEHESHEHQDQDGQEHHDAN